MAALFPLQLSQTELYMANYNRTYTKHSIVTWMVGLCTHSTPGSSLTGGRADTNLRLMAIIFK